MAKFKDIKNNKRIQEVLEGMNELEKEGHARFFVWIGDVYDSPIHSTSREEFLEMDVEDWEELPNCVVPQDGTEYIKISCNNGESFYDDITYLVPSGDLPTFQ